LLGLLKIIFAKTKKLFDLAPPLCATASLHRGLNLIEIKSFLRAAQNFKPRVRILLLRVRRTKRESSQVAENIGCSGFWNSNSGRTFCSASAFFRRESI
jgi:hypothetical protein